MNIPANKKITAMNLLNSLRSLFSSSRLFIEQEIDLLTYSNSNFDRMYKDLRWVEHLIENATSLKELDWIDTQVDELQTNHKAYTYIDEIANELREDIHSKYMLLTVKQRLSA